MQYNKRELSGLIKKQALNIGFNAVGISKAEELEGFHKHLNGWLHNNYHANMDYMQRNIDKRCNPQLLVEDAKSVISLIVSYFPEEKQPTHFPQIASYAYGIDYHFVLKNRMQQLWDFIAANVGTLQGRMFVDSAPVSDKLWARKAGLGWIGKNSCLINKEFGSYFFICELIVNIELEHDEPYQSNFCGSCTKCIDLCPTKAIVQPGIIDSNKCISYQTIENKKDTIPSEISDNFSNRLFGCDICQDVCPWNRQPLITNIEEFKPINELLTLDMEAWEKMENKQFNKLFKKSALKRAKFTGLKRNLNALTKKEL